MVMPQSDLNVPVRYYLRLSEVVARHGVDLNELKQIQGWPEKLATEPDATMCFARVDHLIVLLAAHTERTDLGFDLGKLLSVTSHSIVGLGMLSSPTAEQALIFLSRYFRLVMPSFRFQYKAINDGAELLFTPAVAMSRDCFNFHVEAIATAALRDVRELTGDVSLPGRIQFSIAGPPHARRYSELRNIKVSFGTEQVPGVRIRFETDLGRVPLTMADPNARGMAEERCRALIAKVAGVRNFADWVSMMLREVNESLPGLVELARVLKISPRTLNRHLEQEGTTFQALAKKIQHELACDRLKTGNMSVTEVAYSLGFTDPANFTRAFRSREGITPSEFRRRLTDATEVERFFPVRMGDSKKAGRPYKCLHQG